MENNDDQCFKWAVTRALHPVDRDAERISKILRKHSEDYNGCIRVSCEDERY